MKKILAGLLSLAFVTVLFVGHAKAAANDLRIMQVDSINDGNILVHYPYPAAGAKGVVLADGSDFRIKIPVLGSNFCSTTTTFSLCNVGISDVSGLQAGLDAKATLASLATVATTGDYNDLANKPSADPMSVATSTRSLTTNTGAAGFQISSTRNTLVSYAVNIVTTATIGGSNEGYVTLEVAPTNSATASDWYEVGARCRNGQNITLALALQSVQNIGCTLSAVIPAGSFAKIRTVNVSGTPTYTYVSGQESQL